MIRLSCVAMLCLGLTACGHRPNDKISTGCITGLTPISIEDVPPEMIQGDGGSSTQYGLLFYRSSRLDGVCLDAMTQWSDRAVDVEVSGQTAIESNGYVSRLFLPGGRSLVIPSIKDEACQIASSPDVAQKQISSFSCKNFSYYKSNLGDVHRGTVSLPSSRWPLPWSNIDVDKPQYFYTTVSMPGGGLSAYAPDMMTVQLKIVPMPE